MACYDGLGLKTLLPFRERKNENEILSTTCKTKQT